MILTAAEKRLRNAIATTYKSHNASWSLEKEYFCYGCDHIYGHNLGPSNIAKHQATMVIRLIRDAVSETET